MSITVVGSVGLDTVETPSGRNEEGLGGAAVYFSLAAANFVPVNLVGIVGEDFPAEHVALLESKQINLEGLERAEGKTFRWSGKYHDDVNERDTLDTQLNVFETFHPKLPESTRNAPYLFLGNIHPALQLEVLDQAQPKFIALDTMNLWLTITLGEVKKVLARVNCLIINDGEAKQLTGEMNLRDAARAIRAMGPSIVVIKKGEHGCMLFGADGEIFSIPALPLEVVMDPTGAGDSFAGGFMGHIARSDATDFETLKQAVVYGSASASCTCEAFGPDALAAADTAKIQERYAAFKQLTSF
ncbi:MAG: sugar kinase [Candidatus Hydrogenedentes bacterium]|nr:sugar kinase [Candidatus Hydrogenedentota bacterium]